MNDNARYRQPHAAASVPTSDPGPCGVCGKSEEWRWWPFSEPGTGQWYTYCWDCRGTTRLLHYRWQDADEDLVVCPDCEFAILEDEMAFIPDEVPDEGPDEVGILCLPCARERILGPDEDPLDYSGHP